MENVLGIKPAFSFSCDNSAPKTLSYSHMTISQLHDTVYIGYPQIKSILAFDLQGNYLYSIKINIPQFIIGKFCPMSENVLVICNAMPSASIYLITTDGVVITEFPTPLNHRIIDCISSEKYNIFYILTFHSGYSFGKEGMLKLDTIFVTNFVRRRLKAISIIDDDMNMIIRYRQDGTLYIYNTREDVLRPLPIKILSFSKVFVFDGYVICPDMRRHRNKIAICQFCPHNSSNVSYVMDIGKYDTIHSKLSAKTSIIHVSSRKLYLGNRENNITVYNLDDLLEKYHRMQNEISKDTHLYQEEVDDDSNYYDLFV
ncbi:hypothetical protein LOD99_9914 [Oopsacas minuta]|uniref:Uncharacterized protein n=1 Tax=Oopsacas minuta TaxID=111878 RepID=A0AAV7KK01_9METZ|nr:hypothetical protein LOD99_9914 [Oopsacas minuta]